MSRHPLVQHRRTLLALAVLAALVPMTSARAQPAGPDKAALAWTLPWDADWVTAVAFLGNHRIAAGNNLGQILVWELPDKTGGPARRRSGGCTATTTPSTAWSRRRPAAG